ncbi:MAG: hypothetical protein WCI02_04990 [Planctomycetota bacterium]
MSPAILLADEIESAAKRLLGQQPSSLAIQQWCEEYRRSVADITNGRGVSLPSIAIIGAKGQGKTWIARQLVLDEQIAASLPSGVLSTEATTRLHWIGSIPPDAMDVSRELFVPCPAHRMLDLGKPYLVIDTPGYTDDDRNAAAIAKDALALAPIKLLVARRDQLRSAIHAQLAALTEGAVCVPVVTCVPIRELFAPDSSGNHKQSETSNAVSLRSDMEWYAAALAASAPATRFLEPILVADFEADGDESRVGLEFGKDLKDRISGETLESMSATKASRMGAAGDRLQHRVSQLLDTQVPQLSHAVRRLHEAADALPTQAIEAVLGSKLVLKSAVRDRIRAELITGTSLIWFPYRTLLSILGFTHGAWDRLLLSMTGSIPSIFGTFVAWARNLSSAREANRGLSEGIRDQLNRQIQDRLQPAQQQFYRTIDRIRGSVRESRAVDSELSVRLAGVDELQSQAREVFEYTLERHRISRWLLQSLGAIASILFWALMAGPILAVYRQYFAATYQAWIESSPNLSSFPSPSASMLLTSFMISLFPVLILAMLVMGWFQRASRLNSLSEEIYRDELKKVDELQRTGVIDLYYDDPLLESAEYLVNLDRAANAKTET